MKLLIVAPSWLGDMVMTQPLVARLKAGGETEIHVLAPVAVLPVAMRMPGVDHAHLMPIGHGQLALGKRRALGRALMRQAFDAAYVLPNSFKSALVPWFAKIPRRTGWRGEFRFCVLNDRHVDASAAPRMVDRFLALAPGSGDCRPRLVAEPGNTDRVIRELGLETDAPIVALCPGSAFGPAKRWPVRHFAEVARYCGARGAAVWLIGSSDDRPVCAEIAKAYPAVKNLAGLTDLCDAIDLLSIATVVVTNDSGLMHVAAALDRKIVALYGSTSPAFTPPLHDLAEVLTQPIECSPCFQRTCRFGHLRCLTEIGPERVIERLSI
ncbi:MAG: lipopolysaccharide heptosyltransferase II [Gammaproteobacteria bacterium]|nr:lipopolysaccharide heptosyltransferase II [Gammaproteobacteria bacterium]